MARVLFHIDINAFFASAEILKKPSLAGRPIAIGSVSRHGVLSTASYEARDYGVHSAMPVYEALRLCPDLELVQPDFAYYRELSANFFHYLYQYTNQIEPASIDECYMDVTEIIKAYKRPMDLAFQIQNGVYKETGLHVSIGIAPTKFLAKMASDMRKPNGITILRKVELSTKLWPLPIEDMVGIGKKTVPKLKKQGIMTIGDFASEENENTVLSILGRSGYSLLLKARGKSTNRLSYSNTRQSISLGKTYENDLYSMDEILSCVRLLTLELSEKMKRKNYKGKLVSLTLRDLDFHNIVRSQSLKEYTNEFAYLYEALQGIIEQNYIEDHGYRHITIHVGSLKNASEIIEQPTLFEKPLDSTSMILKELNHKIDGIHLIKASDLLKEDLDE